MKKQLSTIVCLTMMGLGFSQSSYWTKSNTEQKNAILPHSMELPQSNTFNLNLEAFRNALEKAPQRGDLSKTSSTTVEFPKADGSMETFVIQELATLHPDLAARYPEIKSYIGKSVQDPSATIRFSISPEKGVQTMRLSGKDKALFIEPLTEDRQSYTLYSRDHRSASSETFRCLVEDQNPSILNSSSQKNANDGTLRRYRIAISTTGEYTQHHGGTKASALAAINATMTRVNGVFENDFAVTMQVISNNDRVIYTNPSTDPYSGEYQDKLQSTLTSRIGESNYDVGHIFVKGADNGSAGCIGCVCVDNSKGRGFTSSQTPEGDRFDIDYVAHEIGHQFGANHTFSIRNERANAHFEPGSGTTIMGYAGITNNDVQQVSDPYFHAFSIEQVTDYVKGTSCQTDVATNNATPTANAGSNYTIPKGTPFVLKGTGTDANNDSLTYCWEQMDENDAGHIEPGPNNTTGVAFRSFSPSSSSERYFPRLETIKAGATSWRWEVIPQVARTLNFRLTVRDNRASGPANNSDDMRVTVRSAAGPFVVNSPNTNVAWNVGSSKTVTWNVAGTTANGINASEVDIYLSTDSGDTYPILLADDVPNDGSHEITVPDNVGTQNRIMVKAANNIFFDISNANFRITEATTGNDTEAPSAPTNLSASSITDTSLSLSWNAATDNVEVTEYDVYRGTTLISTVANTSLDVTGLTANTAYTFSVKAKDAAGNVSSSSNIVNVRTASPDPCDSGATLTANTGSFTDGSGSSNYANNRDCSWLIQPENGGTVTLTFDSFNTEANYDYVLVYDGDSAAATRIGRFSGSSLPSAVTSTGNALFVRFTSDGSVTRAGWAASYTSNTATTPQCSDVTITINLDDYPRETSWDIKDASNTVVASGGTYGDRANGSTVTVTECLAVGDYTFTIYDSASDGLCCSYGNGSYSVTSGTTTHNGASFGASESFDLAITASNARTGSQANNVVFSNVKTTEPFFISIYPNPTPNGSLLNVAVSKKNTTYKVLDMLGKPVLTGSLSNQSIDISELKTGIYILQLDIDGKPYIERIVKQ
ncbi:reprolysin-like metallopeptidase [Aquimarina rhabdastrellae]